MVSNPVAIPSTNTSIDSVDDVMRELAYQHPPASLFFGHYRHYLLSEIAGVDEKRKRVLLNSTTSSSVDRRLINAGQALVETRWNGLLIKFPVQGIAPELYENKPVFSAIYPEAISIVMEREEYRVSLDASSSFACHIRDGMQNIHARVIDVSIGGIGLLVDKDEPELFAGRTYRNCQMRMPNALPATLPFRILHSEELKLDDGRVARHYCCALVGNNPRNEKQLLQFISGWQRRYA